VRTCERRKRAEKLRGSLLLMESWFRGSWFRGSWFCGSWLLMLGKVLENARPGSVPMSDSRPPLDHDLAVRCPVKYALEHLTVRRN